MRTVHALGWLVLLAACGHGAASSAAGSSAPGSPDAPPAMLDALYGDGRTTRSLDELAASQQLAPNEAFRIVELGRDANTSHHLVLLRDREPIHRHDQHDLLVLVLQGSGQMRIGAEERAIGPHSLVYVPRATEHAMRNTSGAPIVGYAMFVPPYDGKDRVLVEGAGAQPPPEPVPTSTP